MRMDFNLVLVVNDEQLPSVSYWLTQHRVHDNIILLPEGVWSVRISRPVKAF